MNKKNLIILGVALIIAIIIGGVFWYFDKGAYAKHPSPMTSSDFPAHSIDVKKYFTPVEMRWNSEIKVPKRTVKSIAGEGNNISQEGAYMQVYQQMVLGYMHKKIYSKFPEGEVPFKDEHRKCINDAEDERGQLHKEVCRGEKIESESSKKLLDHSLEIVEEKDNVDIEYRQKIIDEYNSGKRTIYDTCHLPAEVTHRLYIKQYAEWEKCTEDFIKKLEDNNHL